MNKYAALLEALSFPEESKVDPIWIKNMNLVRSLITMNRMPDFLTIQQIQAFMFMNAGGELLQTQWHFLEKVFSEEDLERILKDNMAGNPPSFKVNDKFLTNHNNVHHLYHISRYIQRINQQNLNETENVLEWGGGYGNFAKILLKACGQNKTYTIVDLPEMCVLQKWYLDQQFDPNEVNLLTETTDEIIKGKINILPISLYLQKDILENQKFDLFVSTWALSESPIETQQLVIDKKFYGAKNFLVGFHQCGNHIPFMKESTNLGHVLKRDYECTIEDIKCILGVNYYAFK